MSPAPPDLSRHLPAVPAEWQLALGQAVVAVAVAFGAPLDEAQQLALVSFAALVFGLLVTAGTALRRGRAKHLGHVFGPAVDAEELAALLELAGTPRPSPRLTGDKAARQLAVVEQSAADAEAAQRANDVDPPEPGTYPDEPTGS